MSHHVQDWYNLSNTKFVSGKRSARNWQLLHFHYQDIERCLIWSRIILIDIARKELCPAIRPRDGFKGVSSQQQLYLFTLTTHQASLQEPPVTQIKQNHNLTDSQLRSDVKLKPQHPNPRCDRLKPVVSVATLTLILNRWSMQRSEVAITWHVRPIGPLF